MNTTNRPSPPKQITPPAGSGASRLDVSRLLADRTDGVPAWALIAQLFIGLGWLRAATEKMIHPDWWTGAELRLFLDEHTGSTIGWYSPFADLVVEPFAPLVAVVVMVTQAVIGVLFVTGRRLPVALAGGIALNLHFLAAGAVNPSAFYLVIEVALALWLFERSTRPMRLECQVASVAAGVAGVLSIPFISTMHPAEVVDDPALMFITLAGLVMVACELVHRRHSGGRGLP